MKPRYTSVLPDFFPGRPDFVCHYYDYPGIKYKKEVETRGCPWAKSAIFEFERSWDVYRGPSEYIGDIRQES
jgi:hypothetical protein